jgi:hypothetical protein
MTRYCDCGKQLYRQTKGNQCKRCSDRAVRIARPPKIDADYLLDVPQMTENEYEATIDPARDAEAAIAIERQTRIVRQAKVLAGIDQPTF